MDTKDLRSILSQTLETVAELVKNVNESVADCHAIKMAILDADPALHAKIQAHYQRVKSPSEEPVAAVLFAIQNQVRQLQDDSLWKD
jgi:hypothetical protein